MLTFLKQHLQKLFAYHQIKLMAYTFEQAVFVKMKRL